MRVSSVLAAAVSTAILMLSSSSFVQVATASPCNVAFSKTRNTAAKKVVAGKTFIWTESIKNTGSTKLNDLYFQVALPNFLVPVKATAPKLVNPLLQDQYVWFRKMQLPAHKTLKVKVTVGVKSCQPAGTVQIPGIAYQLDGTGQVVCSSETTPYTINVVRKKSASSNKWGASQKHASWDDDDCVTPAPDPTSPYNLIAENQRCVDAKLLGSRRRLEAAEQEEQEERELANTYTPNQCFQACGVYLQVTRTPYYFNLDRSRQCYCCIKCLGRIYDPDFKVSLVFLVLLRNACG